MNYTKGEWKAYKAGNNFIIDDGRPISNNVIAKVPYSLANAQLISAAPEMYEALKQSESALAIAESYRQPDQSKIIDAHEIVRQALAKAEGRQV